MVDQLKKSIRTRIAPSPTGEDIHIGTLYTALINYTYAKKNDGAFLIRIEDTDRTRFVEGSEEKMLASLKSFGISYNEGPDVGGPYGPYRQSERKEQYKKYAEKLVEKGKAYYCFCSKERLDQIRKEQQEKKLLPRYDKHCLNSVKNALERIAQGEEYVIRLNVIADKKIWFEDMIRGKIEFDSNQIDDQVLLKSDGFPTYHLAVVIDDYLMKISHVIRAEEWITSTPKHIILYESFGWELPVFVHLPILRNPDRSKLSKRKNPVWASWYLQEGFLPEAVINFLALMGWSHPQQKEIFSLTEFTKLFELRDIKPVGPIFDIEKLKWMNGVYIREQISIEDLCLRLLKLDPELEKIEEDIFKKLVEIAKTRMKTLKEFKEMVLPFLIAQQLNRDSQSDELRKKLVQEISIIEEWNKDTIQNVIQTIVKTNGINFKDIYKAILNTDKGLPIADVLEILGKKKTLELLS